MDDPNYDLNMELTCTVDVDRTIEWLLRDLTRECRQCNLRSDVRSFRAVRLAKDKLLLG